MRNNVDLRRVYVSLDALQRGQKGMSEAVDEHPEAVGGLSSVERAALLAGMNNAVAELRQSAEDRVLFSPKNRIGSLMQSLLANAATSYEPVPGTELLEAKFDKWDWLGWARTLWLLLNPPIKFLWQNPPFYPETIPQFANSARLALFSDWGTGMYGAPTIAAQIQSLTPAANIVMHLGDVYYSGTSDEFLHRFTTLWPRVDGALYRALNGNHEMYSGGAPYWNVISHSPFDQKASCFAYRNDNWLMVGLDTAYIDHDLSAAQVNWLADMIKLAENRRVVLFSHHQPFSLLEHCEPQVGAKLADLLENRRIFAWYWGHEHSCVVYDKHDVWKLYGRCIGHGGMPGKRPGALGPPRANVQFTRLMGTATIPGAWVLDGPNDLVVGEEKKFTPHGFMTLEFRDKTLTERYYNPDGTELGPPIRPDLI